MLTLYGFLVSGNVWKVRQMLAHTGLPYRRVEVNQMAGETSDPRFLGINPMGKVPVLRWDDGRVLSESGAILLHLARGTRYWPSDPWQQAQTLRWMFWEQYSHEPTIAVNRFLLKFQSAAARTGKEELIRTNRHRGARALAVMDQHLRAHPWFSGASYGMADIALYAYTHVAEEGEFDLRPYTAVGDWLDRVRSQPGHIGLLQEASVMPVLTLAEASTEDSG